ncbi:hypothetical protein [Geodermatophilus sabuli]|uniref:YfhO family protein n=1 Tax=Geodermatophilus sabuli TaxID=1564158 RepID=A0A285EHV3_9ACTN|nr:hypothetical protein [Geodermatophilus sabuli]MBB3086103.1 hypothetical protein [Geodermatophilus sabuli]SNX98443.1 hypothetical protein SAMN06893097_110227 [Geodermatophilus sabuli]
MTAGTHEQPASVAPPGAAVDAGTGPAPRRRRRVPEWLVAWGVGALVWALGVIPQWRGDFFYYVGDQHEQFAPLWHLFGQQLRAGQWPAMDPAGWVGGNYAAEALTGIWNPVVLLNSLLVSTFDNLSLAAFVVMVEFLGVLAMGVFLLARGYGAARWPAAVVATALPVAGFTLWYEASGWPAGLMAFTWVTHFWWSAHRLTRGRLSPVVPFLFGFLAVTTGNPYGPLGLAVVVAALGIDLLVRRQWGRLAHLAVVGVCVGTVALLVFLPLLGATPVSSREQLADVVNDTFLVPDLGDLAAASSPSYLPSITNWNGALLESVPSTYLAWFVLPLLPWLRWDRLRRRARMLVSVFVVLGWYLLATLGPSNLWLFRWPVRLVEYLWLPVAVLVAVVLTAGLATDGVRRRAVLSGAVVVGGAYLAWAAQPAGLGGVHLAGVLLVGVFTALAVLAGRRRGLPALGAVVVLGTAAVLTFQTSVFPARPEGSPPPVLPAYDLAEAAEGMSAYEGTVLQLAALADVTTEQMRGGEILFGNLPRAAGASTVTSYSGIGFREFTAELCMDYRGAVCPEAVDRVWQPAGPGYDVPLVDAMEVSTLVVQRSLRPDVVEAGPPPGWRVALETPARVVWVREEPLADDGRVSWASPGTDVLADSATAQREEVRYRAEDAGRLLFTRLAWPGYTATVDGRPTTVVDGPVGLLAVEVPAGEHTLVVEYRAPGLRAGALAAGAAALVVLVQSAVWWWGRRRRRPTRP